MKLWLNTGTLTEHPDIAKTPEPWQMNQILEEQTEYHGTVEQKNSATTEPQNNTKKYYKYITTTYRTDDIAELKTKLF